MNNNAERICTELTHGCCPIPDVRVRPIFAARTCAAGGRGLWLLPSAQDGRAIKGQEPPELKQFGVLANGGMFWVSEAALKRMQQAQASGQPAPFTPTILAAMQQRLATLDCV